MPFVNNAKKAPAGAAGANQAQASPKSSEKKGFDIKLLLIPAVILVVGLLGLSMLRGRFKGGNSSPAGGVAQSAATIVAAPAQAVAHVAENVDSTVIQPAKQAARHYFGLE